MMIIILITIVSLLLLLLHLFVLLFQATQHSSQLPTLTYYFHTSLHSHAIVSSSVGPEYYVGITSFVDKTQLEPSCSVLLHNKVGCQLNYLLLFILWQFGCVLCVYICIFALMLIKIFFLVCLMCAEASIVIHYFYYVFFILLLFIYYRLIVVCIEYTYTSSIQYSVNHHYNC